MTRATDTQRLPAGVTTINASVGRTCVKGRRISSSDSLSDDGLIGAAR